MVHTMILLILKGESYIYFIQSEHYTFAIEQIHTHCTTIYAANIFCNLLSHLEPLLGSRVYHVSLSHYL